jgi:hypothetical protein
MYIAVSLSLRALLNATQVPLCRFSPCNSIRNPTGRGTGGETGVKRGRDREIARGGKCNMTSMLRCRGAVAVAIVWPGEKKGAAGGDEEQ